LRQLVLLLPGHWVAHFEATSTSRQSIFDEQGEKVKRLLLPKTVHVIFLSGICYLLNLLKGFQNPVKKQLVLVARLKNFYLTVRKTC